MYQALPNRLHIKDSDVAGQGIFALEEIPAGLVLGMSHIVVDEVIYRTPLGGFINHSDEPNCEKWRENDKYFVKTIRHISKGEELFFGSFLIKDSSFIKALIKLIRVI